MLNVKNIYIQSIKIKDRIRKDLGDLTPLMNSLQKYGQITPIMINTKHELIAGHRRLEAARRLGWQTVQSVIVEKEKELDKLELEMEENLQRRELSADELIDGFQRINRLSRPNIFKRIFIWIINFFRRLFGKNLIG
jgi:ParB family chromosome partitioning protein